MIICLVIPNKSTHPLLQGPQTKYRSSNLRCMLSCYPLHLSRPRPLHCNHRVPKPQYELQATKRSNSYCYTWCLRPNRYTSPSSSTDILGPFFSLFWSMIVLMTTKGSPSKNICETSKVSQVRVHVVALLYWVKGGEGKSCHELSW